MVYAARECSLVAQSIVDGHVAQFNFVGHHHYGVAHQLISGVQRRNGSFAIHNQLTRQIDVVEFASHTCQAFAATGNA